MPTVPDQSPPGVCNMSQSTTHKLMAVVFWFALNAMVISVILVDPSALSNHVADAPRLFLSLVGLTGILYLRAAFMDPGYLPHKRSPQEGDLKYNGRSKNDKWPLVPSGSDAPPPPPPPVDDLGKELDDDVKKQKEAEIAGNQRDEAMKAPLSKRWVEVCGLRLWPYYKYMYDPDEPGFLGDKYCNICERGVALRAKHCSACGKCVARYDHHCIWLGNCVGERNHGLFWWYLVCQTTVIIWGLYYLWSAIKWTGFSDEALGAIEGFVWMNGLKIIVFLFILLWSWLPLCLLAYHTYLLYTNQTTWEFNRKTRITYLRHLDTGSRPFDGGAMHNIRLICCTPKLLDWRFHTLMSLDPDAPGDIEQ